MDVTPPIYPLTQPMSEHFLKKLGLFYQLDEGLPEAIREFCKETERFPAETFFARQTADYKGTYLIENGWVFRSRTMENGSRQIVNVAMPGDIIGLNSLLFTQSDFDLVAKTDIEAYHCDHNEFLGLMTKYPAFAAAMFWVDAREESILAERIVSLGRRSAMERTAHVLCEFVSRMEVVGVEDAARIIMPISQNDFADMLGMSLVHMNKTFRSLEMEGVISFRNEILTVNNMKKLEQIAGFENGYLYFARRNDRRSRNKRQ